VLDRPPVVVDKDLVAVRSEDEHQDVGRVVDGESGSKASIGGEEADHVLAATAPEVFLSFPDGGGVLVGGGADDAG
jgi:hypothetical protein